jgi:hypothetical protein
VTSVKLPGAIDPLQQKCKQSTRYRMIRDMNISLRQAIMMYNKEKFQAFHEWRHENNKHNMLGQRHCLEQSSSND